MINASESLVGLPSSSSSENEEESEGESVTESMTTMNLWSVSIDARLVIDQMFKVVKTIRPKTILSNLEAINDSYVLENAKRLNDPARQNEKDKVLIAIPLFADLFAVCKENFHLGDLHTWCADHENLPPPDELDQVLSRWRVWKQGWLWSSNESK